MSKRRRFNAPHDPTDAPTDRAAREEGAGQPQAADAATGARASDAGRLSLDAGDQGPRQSEGVGLNLRRALEEHARKLVSNPMKDTRVDFDCRPHGTDGSAADAWEPPVRQPELGQPEVKRAPDWQRATVREAPCLPLPPAPSSDGSEPQAWNGPSSTGAGAERDPGGLGRGLFQGDRMPPANPAQRPRQASTFATHPSPSTRVDLDAEERVQSPERVRPEEAETLHPIAGRGLEKTTVPSLRPQEVAARMRGQAGEEQRHAGAAAAHPNTAHPNTAHPNTHAAASVPRPARTHPSCESRPVRPERAHSVDNPAVGSYSEPGRGAPASTRSGERTGHEAGRVPGRAGGAGPRTYHEERRSAGRLTHADQRRGVDWRNLLRVALLGAACALALGYSVAGPGALARLVARGQAALTDAGDTVREVGSAIRDYVGKHTVE